MFNKPARYLFVVSIIFTLCFIFSDQVSARFFRVELVPNGDVFNCNTCHEVSGGPRNAFGESVEVLVDPGSEETFWDAQLASMDSDDDGFTNGEELQNSDGNWSEGDPQPGNTSFVSNPGDPDSVPPEDAIPTPTPVQQEDIQIQLETIAEGVNSPVEGVHAGDGSNRLFILEQIGRIRIIENDSLLDEPFLDITDRVIDLNSGYDERGLLGLAFHPQYSENGRFFVYYSAPGGPGNHISILAEYHVSNDDPNQGAIDERVILMVEQPEGNHNGGRIVFGPDGMMYIGLGDGGGGGDQHGEIGNGQNTETLLGSILRIDVDGQEPYGIPSDNPFVDEPGQDEIWAYGLRNPWKFSFDREGSNRLFCADVGQNQWEEVNIITKGGNYGWRVMEGTHCFNPSVGCDKSGKILPIAEYSHRVGVSVTGGYVYRGSLYSSLYGKYIFGDYNSAGSGHGKLFYLVETGDEWQKKEFKTTDGQEAAFDFNLLSFAEDENGEIYVLGNPTSSPLNRNGSVHRITVPGGEPVSVEEWKMY